MESPLPVLHLVGAPVRDPIEHPQEIDDPRDDKQHYQLEFLVLKDFTFELFSYQVLVPHQV